MFSESLVNLKAKELMDSPYLSIKSDVKVLDAIREMDRFKSDYLVVEDKNGAPLGLLTPRVITRLLAKNGVDLQETKLSSLSLEPLLSIKADTKILDILKIMSTKKLSVLAVSYKGKITGVITLHKMLSTIPSVIEDIIERAKFEKEPLFKPEATVMGYCDRCGVWTEKLTYVEGAYYCIDCLTDIYGEEFLTEE